MQRSEYWRCPHCQGILKKGMSWLVDELQKRGGEFGGGTATCTGCGNTVSQVDVYSGKYDVVRYKTDIKITHDAPLSSRIFLVFFILFFIVIGLTIAWFAAKDFLIKQWRIIILGVLFILIIPFVPSIRSSLRKRRSPWKKWWQFWKKRNPLEECIHQAKHHFKKGNLEDAMTFVKKGMHIHYSNQKLQKLKFMINAKMEKL